jgi:hypothetical protein
VNKTLELLAKYNVTEYEMVTWLSNALEHKLGDDDCTERIEKLIGELNALSYRV